MMFQMTNRRVTSGSMISLMMLHWLSIQILEDDLPVSSYFFDTPFNLCHSTIASIASAWPYGIEVIGMSL